MDKFTFDIVFLGGLFPREMEADILCNSIGHIDNAANNLQWSLITGLDEHLKKPVTVINSLYIGAYPVKYRKIRIKNYNFNHSENSIDINTGFVNLPGFKHISKFISIKPYLEKWSLVDSGVPKVIIAYALTNVFVELLSFIKKKYPQILTVIIIPDLPQYMGTANNNGFFYHVLKKFSLKHIFIKIKNIDGFVLLTKFMKDPLNLQNKHIAIIEGISNEFTDRRIHNNTDSDTIDIVYAGTLNELYGIKNLINAFIKISNPNFRLYICGSGDSNQFIVDSAQIDNRIIFKGQLSRLETIELISRATILVNPRQNTEEFTKYSFPSKNMEYLSSGRPLVAYKLDGIPDEYDDFIFYVPDNSIDSLTNKLIEVCSLSSDVLKSRGDVAKKWVVNNKNCVLQTMKIIDLIIDIQSARLLTGKIIS